ncbi:hypothetical protein QMG83_08960 [Salinibacterium sp. G-O1]|uniref:hypothetical protein n=1 Tax=Salinibacterium sp. G-O1 TaxID=3046208 RepID=UPI0024BA508F|nr:hypothetical protein [Salinibacterium sp. G-O1]MDJ0335351.1 hypothetical protein [Salinibacterium sp. G-O1]
MSLPITLPERAYSPQFGPFDHFARAWNRDLEAEPEFDLDGRRSPLLRLPAVSIGTLHYTAPPIEDMHLTTRGMVTEACLRLARWRWQDGKASAWWIAKRLEGTYFPTGVDGYRRNGDPLTRIPRKGLALIAATDALNSGGVEWYCEIPRDDDPWSFETLRLSAALAKFEGSRLNAQRAVSSAAQRRPQLIE